MNTVQDFARRVLLSETLEDKLEAAPPGLADDPGEPEVHSGPGRPAGLRIAAPGRAKVPPVEGMADPAQRLRILHGFCNHELQAAELFAWALLAFPDASPEFRGGLLGILDDEQRHTRMYVEHLAARGVAFGDYPVSGYFWNKAPDLDAPIRFVCAMSLTFENANLDHTCDFASAARRAGDGPTADLIEEIHRDEIRHVAFGWTWLDRFRKGDESMWEAYCRSVRWPLRGALARGPTFHAHPRREAGLEEAFIAALEASDRTMEEGR